MPSNDLFPVQDPFLYSRENLPGSVIARTENIIINKGRDRIRLRVTNTGDRPVQVCLLPKQDGSIILSKHRSAHTTTSSRRIIPCLSIEAVHMENVLTF
jgi:hypothetical protein